MYLFTYSCILLVRLFYALIHVYSTGKSVGIITTARITHATPSALYAHVPERDWEADSDIPDTQSKCSDIARQLLENPNMDKVQV